jgi:hypothetical protein
MITITYTIEVNGEKLSDEKSIPLTAKTDTGARRQARAFMNSFDHSSGNLVFLAFYNSQQGSGYINPDGSVSATGKSWTWSN